MKTPPLLRRLQGPTRLAVGLFAMLMFGFLLLAQRNLWEQAGGGTLPTPRRVLERYHGSPERSRLHMVLDPMLPVEDPHNMSQFLGGSQPEDALTKANRAAILTWVEQGAPREGWATVAPIFTEVETCGACHTAGGEKADLPFDNYEQVVPVTVSGGGMALAPLLISAHNHLFGFSVLALLIALGVTCSTAPRWMQTGVILAAFLGAGLDIAAWFLTRSFGAPFHWLVMAGGGLFGSSIALGALLILRDILGERSPPSGAEHAGSRED